MLKIKGKLLAIIESVVYKDDKGFPVTTKPKLQMLVARKNKNGNISNELHNISVPQKTYDEMKNRLNQDVEIEIDYYISKDKKIYFTGI